MSSRAAVGCGNGPWVPVPTCCEGSQVPAERQAGGWKGLVRMDQPVSETVSSAYQPLLDRYQCGQVTSHSSLQFAKTDQVTPERHASSVGRWLRF